MPLPSGTRVNGAPSQSRVWTNADLKTTPREEVLPWTRVRTPESEALAALGSDEQTLEEILASAKQTLRDSDALMGETMALPSHNPISHEASSDYTPLANKVAPYALLGLDVAAIPAGFYPPTAAPARLYQGARAATNIGSNLAQGNIKEALTESAINLLPLGASKLWDRFKGVGKAAAGINYRNPPSVKYAGPAPQSAVDEAARRSANAARNAKVGADTIRPDLPIQEGEILGEVPQKALTAGKRQLTAGARKLPGWAQKMLSGGTQRALPAGRAPAGPAPSPSPSPSAPTGPARSPKPPANFTDPGANDEFVRAMKPGAGALTPEEAAAEDEFWQNILAAMGR